MHRRTIGRRAPGAGLLRGVAIVLAGISCSDRNVTGPAGPGDPEAETAAAAAPLVFDQVSAGDLHTCGLVTDGRLYCWGWNVFGQLGDGTQAQRLRPVPVKGGLRFRQVSAGFYGTCAVTTGNRAYCWGHIGFENRLTPLEVPGGRSFRQVSLGADHACGVTTNDRAFCWGTNELGELGNGTSNPDGNFDPAPVAVVGGLLFRGVSVAVYHSCGVTNDDRAYCWGGDAHGQLGDGASSGGCSFSNNTLPCRKRPTAVSGGQRFRQVDAGGGEGPGEGGAGRDGGRTCGVTTDARAFCWGDGSHGQNGDGTLAQYSSPVRVAGDLRFRAISSGVQHTCALTMSDRAYCWGDNTFGQIGDGTQTLRRRPRAVTDGHRFRHLSAGGAHTCGTSLTQVGYCWGSNSGQIGDGTEMTRLAPVPVGSPM
jgi:alpha-tubulin suppressor-like RCC1 family protein